jgi:ketosteroid isomerase-like protein
MSSKIKTPEQKAIAKLDAAWSKAAKMKDVEGVVALYSSKGSVVWPDQKARHGTKAIRTAWEKAYKADPKLSLTFEPERIDIACGGDIAVDFGSVSFGGGDASAKYLVVWKRENGAWKVLYDCWNSNKPEKAPKPAPKSTRPKP